MSENQAYDWKHFEAIDSWFFRDGKPFNRGEDQADIRSIFPPSSSTMVGTTRYALAINNGWNGTGKWTDSGNTGGRDLKSILGDGPEQTGELAFLGPFVSWLGKPLFAMPHHVLGHEKTNRNQGAQFAKTFEPVDWLVPSPIGLSDCNFPQDSEASGVELSKDAPSLPSKEERLSLPGRLGLAQLGKGDKPPAPTTDFYLDVDGMRSVLCGELPTKSQCHHHSRFFRTESRVGIERDLHTRSVRTGQLYNPHFIRPECGTQLLLGVRGVPEGWQWPSLIAMGGEARMSAVSEVDSTNPLKFTPDDSKSDESKPTSGSSPKGVAIVSLTPCYFESPDWLGPRPGDPATALLARRLPLTGRSGTQTSSDTLGGNIKSIAVDRPTRVGGWDSIAKRPTAKHAFVPAGTVWWISDSANVGQLGDLVQIGGKQHLGYGLAVIAGCPLKPE